MNHTVGSHSDDRGGDSDLPCYCEERSEHNSSDPETTMDTASLPCTCDLKKNFVDIHCPFHTGFTQSPPKDRDSLDSIIDELYTLKPGGREKAKAAIRHLSTKEMLDKLPEKKAPSDPKYHNKPHKPEPRPPHICDDGDDCEHWVSPGPKSIQKGVNYNDGWNAAIDTVRAALTREEKS